MAESTIPVDLLNPGQVFACLGFMEAAETLFGDAEAAFDWSNRSHVEFRLRARGDTPPVAAVLGFLAEASVRAEAPPQSRAHAAWIDSWGPLVAIDPEDGYPNPDPSSPAMVICTLRAGGRTLVLDHWGDGTDRDNAKFWAGARGYPGAALARDALELVRSRLDIAVMDPFNLGAPQSSSFRLDWRRDYIPLEAGFSLNNHGKMEPMGFPLVELLGALGLTNARPRRPNWRDKLRYEYGVIGRDAASNVWFPPSLLRAALGAIPAPFPRRKFTMLLDWPGQENQARAITTVMEESIDD